MEEKKIAIIIANYNNGHFFKDCYLSLINQTIPHWEAIIIDDCSTDHSFSIIEKTIKDDSRFKLYKNQSNVGYQKTVEKAISLTQAAYFGRLDPDDALSHDALEKCLETHKKYPEVGLVYSNQYICNENLEIIDLKKGVQVEGEIFYEGEIISFATLKREIYDKTSGIDVSNKRAEDKDIYLKMSEIAPVKYIDYNLYLYRIHEGGVSSTHDKIDLSYYWYWVAIIKAAERRGINVEDEFNKRFVRSYRFNKINNTLQQLKKNRWIKLGIKLGFIKI